MKVGDAEMLVYRDDLGVNHLPSRPPGPMTLCGFDHEFMQERQHPISHAARWCHLCFKTIMEASNQDTSPAKEPK